MNNGFAQFHQLVWADVWKSPHKHINASAPGTDGGDSDADQLCIDNLITHKQTATGVVVGRLPLVSRRGWDVGVVPWVIKKAGQRVVGVGVTYAW